MCGGGVGDTDLVAEWGFIWIFIDLDIFLWVLGRDLCVLEVWGVGHVIGRHRTVHAEISAPYLSK